MTIIDKIRVATRTLRLLDDTTTYNTLCQVVDPSHRLLIDGAILAGRAHEAVEAEKTKAIREDSSDRQITCAAILLWQPGDTVETLARRMAEHSL